LVRPLLAGTIEPMPRILLCNDDGISASGLGALHAALADLGDVVVVAPDRERSATGHAFTLGRPLALLLSCSEPRVTTAFAAKRATITANTIQGAQRCRRTLTVRVCRNRVTGTLRTAPTT
jgi:broad specificity polyphosphatase/5'/3'-nucleotidase SurE